MKIYIICSIFALTACIRTPRYYTTYHEYKEPIVINESIDDVIDADERLSYELFHGIDNFHEARIYEMSHGGYIARIMAGEDEYIAVNGDAQAIPILRDYLARYDEIIVSLPAWEDKWKIVDYDHLGQPITEGEIKQVRTFESRLYVHLTDACAGSGFGAFAGLIIGLWHKSENPGSIDMPNFAPCIGPVIGAMGGCVLGLGVSYFHTTKGEFINTIKKARQARRIDE